MRKMMLVAGLLATAALCAYDASAQTTTGQPKQGTEGRPARGQSGQGKAQSTPQQQTQQPQRSAQPAQQPQRSSQPAQQPRSVQSAPQPRRAEPAPQVRRSQPVVRWQGGHGAPPAGAWRHARSHDWCLDKARRLHDYERRAAGDGHLSRGERVTIAALRADLDRSCGRGRWHPDRGWFY